MLMFNRRNHTLRNLAFLYAFRMSCLLFCRFCVFAVIVLLPCRKSEAFPGQDRFAMRADIRLIIDSAVTFAAYIPPCRSAAFHFDFRSHLYPLGLLCLALGALPLFGQRPLCGI